MQYNIKRVPSYGAQTKEYIPEWIQLLGHNVNVLFACVVNIHTMLEETRIDKI